MANRYRAKLSIAIAKIRIHEPTKAPPWGGLVEFVSVRPRERIHALRPSKGVLASIDMFLNTRACLG